jgi:hypothetical protein
MTASAILLGVTGIAFSFFPEEIVGSLQLGDNRSFPLILQLTGALYFGFAMVNWMAKGSIIGGIYSKPVAMGNFAHFLVGGLALLKNLRNDATLPYALWALTVFYVIFAVLFGLIGFRHPAKSKQVL